MKVALEVWSSRYQEVESTCLYAESLGFDGFYYGESPHGLNLDCWTTLAGLAKATERIRLGPVITNVLPTYRSIALLAKQAETVNEISAGRVDFRTGVGAATSFAKPWWEPFGIEYPAYDERLAAVEDALQRLPSLLAADAAGSEPPPITLAASGDRAMALASTYAAVWETSFCTPSEYSARRARFDSMTQGRTVTGSLEIDAFVAATAVAADRLLGQVSLDRGRDEDLEPVFERALTGDPETAAATLASLAAVGVDQVVVALHDPHNRDALDAVWEAVRIFRA